MDVLLVEPAYKNKYPPMSLMKISTYHKQRKDTVVFIKGNKKLYGKWDRIYITTLFTFNYKDVLKTINHYKKYVTDKNNIYVGGIMATLLSDDLRADSDIGNIVEGRLLDSAMLGFNDHVNIDILPLDYDILNDTEYVYPSGDNFFAYTTRGCVNKCPFCAVPTLEGKLTITNNIVEQIRTARELYGDKRNVLLMDNNILGIPINNLQKIVDDLNELGFVNEPNYKYPSEFLKLFDTYCRYESCKQNTALIREKMLLVYKKLETKKMAVKYKNALDEHILNIGSLYVDKFQMIIDNIDFFIKLEKKYAYKKSMQRYVDFNQGMDGRLLTEEKMAILSALPIRPFRIAFDKIKYSEIYQKAIRLAAKYNVCEFSNYLLYNFEDNPFDLYKRLEINVSLAEELGVHIYSFPMKFEPIENKQRGHVDSNWNLHYLRSVKAILNVSKGVFGGDRSFFERAFGKNKEEFFEILSMPKDILTYRKYYEENGVTQQWKTAFHTLTKSEKNKLIFLVSNDKFSYKNKKINYVLQFYRHENLDKKRDIINIAI
ncbi:hypothetical protein [Pectinatus frisingensis]|uniref:hypothetical protein n=1 Tax=Pectinatus frisingensis TaxID=865 RepID=UPI0018C70E7B|nr:hypothetical protein [Pectinatus frisingensis]